MRASVMFLPKEEVFLSPDDRLHPDGALRSVTINLLLLLHGLITVDNCDKRHFCGAQYFMHGEQDGLITRFFICREQHFRPSCII